jgi:hypothetical protein
MNKKRVIDITGKILLILSLIFVGYKVWTIDVDWSLFRSRFVISGLGIIAFVYAGNTIFCGFSYARLVRDITKTDININKVIASYCVINLYKYLPGNVMHLIGRNKIAEDENVPHIQVVTATVIEQLMTLAGSVIISIWLVSDSMFAYLKKMDISNFAIFAAAVVVLVLFVVFFALLRKKIFPIFRKGFDAIRRIPIGSLIVLLVMNISMLFITSMLFTFVMLLFGQEVSPVLISKLTGLFVFAWMIGYITPGVPGGIGVREAIIMMFMGQLVDPAILTVSALGYRVVAIAAELLAVAITAPMGRKKSV